MLYTLEALRTGAIIISRLLCIQQNTSSPNEFPIGRYNLYMPKRELIRVLFFSSRIAIILEGNRISDWIKRQVF